ncbi:cytochrome P450 [Zalerion maritima]|uniref:Cytochrome P450 n=1 Tax=Zalerion maritima TaxID=339359 RepID=A0AAD5RXB8_9PEZI|nr:cytochrome P450 [Zalerion maritima]
MASTVPHSADELLQLLQAKISKIDITAGRLVLVVVAIWFVIPNVFKFLSRLVSPMQRLPGPFLNKISGLPLKISIVKGKSHIMSVDLHRKYGPIAVIAPSMISVSDPQEIKRIIHIEDWPKSEAFYGNFRQDRDRPTLMAFTDKKPYSHRKRLVSSMFGIKYIRSMQCMMRDCIKVAVRQLYKATAKGPAKVDMQHLVQSLAVDIIGITTFGESFHVVEQGSHPLPLRIKKALALSGLLHFLPWITSIPFMPSRDPFIDSFTADVVHKRKALNKTLNSRAAAGEKVEEPRDLLQTLVENSTDEAGSAFRFSDIQDEAVVLLTAGSETTANAQMFTLLQLCKNPDKMAKVQKEVDEWYPPRTLEEKEVDCEYSLAGMTYLSHCIDEGMRLYPGQATGSPRETATKQCVSGYSVPKGVTVFPATQSVHLDEKVWPDAKSYVPERWEDVHASHKTDSQVSYWPFSAGSRVCIGKNFALQEMHLTLVELLRRFEFGYVEGQDETTMYRVAQQLEADQYLVSVKRRVF